MHGVLEITDNGMPLVTVNSGQQGGFNKPALRVVYQYFQSPGWGTRQGEKVGMAIDSLLDQDI